MDSTDAGDVFVATIWFDLLLIVLWTMSEFTLGTYLWLLC